jgi:hypothetical protein
MLLKVLDEIIAALTALATLTFLGGEDLINFGIILVTGLCIWLFKIIFLYDLEDF